MPALDLPRLHRQTSALAACLGQPRAFLAALRQLLEETADRAYRAGRAVMADAPLRSYHTPKPVMRAIAAALKEPASANPDAALAAGDPLWPAGWYEERVIAAQLVGLAAPARPAEALKRLAAWIPDVDHPQLADALAAEALCPLIRLNTTLYLTDARGWAASPHKWTRRFAVGAMTSLAKDSSFGDVPSLLNVIKEAMMDSDLDVRKAVAEALVALAARSPSEVSRFLKDHARQTDRPAVWIIDRILPALDENARESIRVILREAETKAK